ncbi:unnamed protein product [Aspergillus oryzae]|uniref:Unnamed protein product n=1 Tax=Aspergillus oryzae TaxID=5062 RepID=A0AAN4YWR1_ASPOZ|nr:unnamed protein product [Aspergillus oryzae]GMG38248.1 unnamed protein product [Aspergillus oryzae]
MVVWLGGCALPTSDVRPQGSAASAENNPTSTLDAGNNILEPTVKVSVTKTDDQHVPPPGQTYSLSERPSTLDVPALPLSSTLTLLPSPSMPPPSQTYNNFVTNATADAIFTDSTATIRLFIVDVGAEKGGIDTEQSLFRPQFINAAPGDMVLFRFYGAYALYSSDFQDPCHAPRLSQNAVPTRDKIPSHQVSVQSTKPLWFSASLIDKPHLCNNETVFAVNPGNQKEDFLANASMI